MANYTFNGGASLISVSGSHPSVALECGKYSGNGVAGVCLDDYSRTGGYVASVASRGASNGREGRS